MIHKKIHIKYTILKSINLHELRSIKSCNFYSDYSFVTQYFFFYPDILTPFLKSETNLVWGSWLPLLISVFPGNRTCVLTLASI
jgi:hypothetical protein